MKTGEIVERLIDIKDSYDLMSFEYEAVLEACNLLEKLPRLEEAEKYAPVKN